MHEAFGAVARLKTESADADLSQVPHHAVRICGNTCALPFQCTCLAKACKSGPAILQLQPSIRDLQICMLMRSRCQELSRRIVLAPSFCRLPSSRQLLPSPSKRCVSRIAVVYATKAQASHIDVAAGRQKDTKQLARAFRSVPVNVVTVSKNSSRAAENLAGETPMLVCRISSIEISIPLSQQEDMINSQRCAADEYAEKIRRYAPFTASQLRTNPKKAASPDVAIEAEGAKVLQSLQPQVRPRKMMQKAALHCSTRFPVVQAHIGLRPAGAHCR